MLLIISKKVEAIWSTKTREHYENRGYKFTSYGDTFLVRVEDLTKGSKSVVKFICDYCNGKHQVEEEMYRSYLSIMSKRKFINKDSCSHRKCINMKLSEVKTTTVSPGNSLGDKFPELVQEWHPTKNKGKTAYDYNYSSHQMVWWMCNDGHEWNMRIDHRTRKEIPCGCPYCSGKRATIDNCLLTVCPDVAKEWHPYKNHGLTPQDVTKGSGKVVWWVCDKGHEWKIDIASRTRDKNPSNCPLCSATIGEKKIIDYLESNKISFVFQYSFDDLTGIGGRLLKFDFGILNNQGQLKFLIEFDGMQHFVNAFGDDVFDRYKDHDSRKDKYCSNNKIPLVRIGYQEVNDISDILNKAIRTYLL